MEQNGISVIIPMLNSEKYVEACVKSILRQGNVVKEIICVDNGSEDKTKSIIKELKEQDARIELLHCEQKGVSAARNLGIQHANGKYVMFVDSDDYLQKKKLLRLYNRAVKADADILIFGGTSTKPLKTPHWVRRVLSPKNEEVILSKCDNIYNKRGVVPATWNKLYKNSVIKELRFSTRLRVAEDKLFQFCAFTCAEKVKFVRTRIYVYRINDGSVMNRVNVKDKEEQHILAMEQASDWLRENNMLQEKAVELEAWKKTFYPEESTGNGLQKAGFYIRNYGMRSFAELIVGQLLYKKNSGRKSDD